MSRERYAEFIKGIDLKEIFLSSLNCNRDLNPEGDKWTVDLKPSFQLLDSSRKGEILVEADYHVNVKSQEAEVFVVNATFVIVYMSNSDLEFDDEIKEVFLKSNPTLNSWPYAREIISSLTTRMGFPPLLIEPYKVY